MADQQGLPRPTLAAWAVYRSADGYEVRVPKYIPSEATNNKAVQDDDVPKGATYVRDEPLDEVTVSGDASAALRQAAQIAAEAALEDVRALAPQLEAAADALGGA